MQTLTLTLPRPHSAQRQIIRESTRFNVLACGRRWGKTTLGVDRLIQPAINRGLPVSWFSPTYKMLSEIWRNILQVLRPIARYVSVQDHRIELRTGGVVECWSLDTPDVARGRKYGRVIIDEAAMVKDLEDAWQAVIRPTLADLEGDLWALSTPRGMNFFRKMFAWGQDPERPDWGSWRQPTSANPYIKPEEIAAMRADMTERQQAQEIDAEFLEDGGGVFRNVAQRATLQPKERINGHSYVGGVDWARTEDYTVFSIIDLYTKQQVALDRFSKVDFKTQLNRFETMHNRYKIDGWIAESNSMGMPLVEDLQEKGFPVYPFTTSNATKGKIIDNLTLAFERAAIDILDDPVQLAELQAYEQERLPSGLVRYSAPSGMHDDTVIALGLAWHGADQGSMQVDWL